MEKYIEFAFNNPKCDEFLNFFEKKDKKIFDNYIRLNKKNNSYEEFLGNPLVFILFNEPKCCLNIAIKFIENYKNEMNEKKKYTRDELKKIKTKELREICKKLKINLYNDNDGKKKKQKF